MSIRMLRSAAMLSAATLSLVAVHVTALGDDTVDAIGGCQPAGAPCAGPLCPKRLPHCNRCGHHHNGPCAQHHHHVGRHGQASAAARAATTPWHGNYYHVMYGQPIALVVPPTAEKQCDYQWGVCGTEVTRIDHQFQRNYPGAAMVGPAAAGPYGFLPTPWQPSSTRQFGVYYVRGPW